MEPVIENKLQSKIPSFARAGEDIVKAKLAVRSAVLAFRESLKRYEMPDAFLHEDLASAS